MIFAVESRFLLTSLHILTGLSVLSSPVKGTICHSEHVPDRARGFITSPEYPMTPNVSVCHSWYIAMNSSYVFTASFEDLDLPGGSRGQCEENYIQFRSSPQLTLCETMTGAPKVYISQANRISITYIRAASQPGRGFALRYTKGPVNNRKCYPDEYMCSDGKCILDRWRCNGADECSTGTDELYCPEHPHPTLPSGYSCGSLSFGCISKADQQYRCYPNMYACDGEEQCQDGRDEAACSQAHQGCFQRFDGKHGSITSSDTLPRYRPNSFCDYLVRVNRGQRVQLRFVYLRLRRGERLVVYDGATDDYDVLGKPYTYHTAPPSELTASNSSVLIRFYYTVSDRHGARGFNITYQEKGICFNDQWRCEFGEDECYDRTLHCDGVWNCPKRGGDERGCNRCPDNQFSCNSSAHCYDEKDHCNGLHNCPDKSDEKNCQAHQCGHANGTFLCDNGHCIFESWVCDRADDCKDNSDEKNCSSVPSRKVITAAVIGSLLCGLLLVLSIGCTCKLHARRMNQLMGGYARHMSPVSRVEQEIWARQSAPPLYDEAMRTSRPYDEAIAALQLAMEQQSAPQPEPPADDRDDVTAPGNPPDVCGDDTPLIDLTSQTDNEAGSEDEAGDVQITIATGAKAQWRRNRHKSRSGSSRLTDEGSSGLGEQPNCDTTRCDNKPENETRDLSHIQLQLNTPKNDSDHMEGTLSGHLSGAVCPNMAFIGDDAGRLPTDLSQNPPDGASVSESDVSVADWHVGNEEDGDVSMLSLD